jgi:hypothetical protein
MAGFVSLDGLFAGRHFDREIIILCVRWYLRFKLSFRDLVEMMAERGLPLAHTTIMRWVRHYAPEFERRWNRFALPAGTSWRMDETYIKVRGEWVYLYRAVDRDAKRSTYRGLGGAGVQRSDHGREFLGINSRGSPAMAPTTTSLGEAGLDAFLDQRPFKLRERTENMEQELALRRRCVHLLGERTEGDAAFLEVSDRGE